MKTSGAKDNAVEFFILGRGSTYLLWSAAWIPTDRPDVARRSLRLQHDRLPFGHRNASYKP